MAKMNDTYENCSKCDCEMDIYGSCNCCNDCRCVKCKGILSSPFNHQEVEEGFREGQKGKLFCPYCGEKL